MNVVGDAIWSWVAVDCSSRASNEWVVVRPRNRGAGVCHQGAVRSADPVHPDQRDKERNEMDTQEEMAGNAFRTGVVPRGEGNLEPQKR